MAENKMETIEERELGWDDEVTEGDAVEFVTLPAGEYPFKVLSFERGEHVPNPKKPGKLPACKKAVIEVELDGGELGTATIRENLFLHTRTRGILHSFFRAIGEQPNPETGTIRMNWQQVPGSTGRAKVKVRSYTKDGEERTINEISRWLEPADEAAPNQGAAYVPGSF